MEIMGTEGYFGKSALLRNVSAPRDAHLSPKLYGERWCPAKFQIELRFTRQVPYFQVRILVLARIMFTFSESRPQEKLPLVSVPHIWEIATLSHIIMEPPEPRAGI